MSILSSTNTGKAAVLIPETKGELVQMISNEIMKNGFNCDLNHIKTHKITDMSRLFANSKFVGDISKWDVSNVEKMREMFWNSKFNGDISKWNVSSVKDMNNMFSYSKFNSDISNWNVSKVEIMWGMFSSSKFKNNISSWKINPKCDTRAIFYKCPIKEEYKPKNIN
jgi:surface protein